MCKSKLVLLLVLFVFFSAWQSQAESGYMFRTEQIINMQKQLDKEILLSKKLLIILNDQKIQLTKLQESENNLKQEITMQSESLMKLQTANSELDKNLIAEQKKNKMLKITIGTVVPVSFCIAIAGGIGLGILIHNLIK